VAIKKTSLREFQQDLVERLKGAADQASSGTRLGVQAGTANLLLRLDEAGEVLPVPAMTSVPLTKPWFLGLANIRGNLHGVIDFALFMGGEPTPRSADSRIMLVADRYKLNVALLISRMTGLRNVQQLTQDSNASAPPWIAASFRDAEGFLWQELAAGELVRHTDFLQAGV
jgi:twitching motility protein PilI